MKISSLINFQTCQNRLDTWVLVQGFWQKWQGHHNRHHRPPFETCQKHEISDENSGPWTKMGSTPEQAVKIVNILEYFSSRSSLRYPGGQPPGPPWFTKTKSWRSAFATAPAVLVSTSVLFFFSLRTRQKSIKIGNFPSSRSWWNQKINQNRKFSVKQAMMKFPTNLIDPSRFQKDRNNFLLIFSRLWIRQAGCDKILGISEYFQIIRKSPSSRLWWNFWTCHGLLGGNLKIFWKCPEITGIVSWPA